MVINLLIAARFVGIKSPIPYKFRRVGGKHLNYGMNFAYGGSGVFETLVPFPNMTTQIGFFETLIKERVFNPVELNRSSVAVVVLSGNDYTAYLARNGTVQVTLHLNFNFIYKKRACACAYTLYLECRVFRSSLEKW